MTEDVFDDDAIRESLNPTETEKELAERLQDESNVEVRKFLERRRLAYARVFDAADADAAFVLQDLAWFTCAHDPQWNDDARRQDRMVARREVYMHVLRCAGLPVDTQMINYLLSQQAGDTT